MQSLDIELSADGPPVGAYNHAAAIELETIQISGPAQDVAWRRPMFTIFVYDPTQCVGSDIPRAS
jgi:hypothetical protein